VIVGGIYGYRRIHAELVRAGEHVGPELVRALMRQLDLVAVQPRPYRKTTDPDPYAPDTVDLVRRGVVDPYQRISGYPGLHVIDGSTISGNLGANPALTITAQFERAIALWPNKGEQHPRPPLGSPISELRQLRRATRSSPTTRRRCCAYR